MVRSPESNNPRRRFFRSSGAALLAGYAYRNGVGLGGKIARADTGQYQSVTIPTHEFYGDIEERLDFPKDWEIEVVKMSGHDTPVLTDEQIIERIRSPIGTKQLRDIAAGKKTAVVTFDDLTRPTAPGRIAKAVIDELNAAGIDDDHILFYAATGTHPTLSQPDARAKLGDEVLGRCAWINHDIMHNFVNVGRTSFINRIEVNAYFNSADVKITLSGIKVHFAAGYGGGAKMVLPGVSSFRTILYNHGVIAGYVRNNDTDTGTGNPTIGMGRVVDNDMRRDMIEAARLAGVDFSVNIIYNGRREPVRVFAGDVEQAHVEACRYAHRHYVNANEIRGGSVDVAVINRYPQTRQGRITAYPAKEGGSGVYILQNPMCLNTDGFLRQYRWFQNASWWETFYQENPGGDRLDMYGQIIIFSQYIAKRDLINNGRRKNVKLARTWDEVLGYLEEAHPDGARVGVYPYYSIQHNPIELL